LGTSIGPYQVVGKLGAGGMGEVYLAEDPRLERRVALKTLSNPLLGSDARSSLLREAKAAAKLSHPNIAAVYDVIEQGDRLHIVMEYVEGETLAALAKRGLLDIEQVVDIAIQLTNALVDAHAHGIIHRDLKPGNIVVTPDGKVKVLDFGLAKVWDPAFPLRASPESIETFVVAGTLGYMAPERLLRHDADHRADLYGVGVILFELLTGRLPFEARDHASQAVAVMTRLPEAPEEIDHRIPSALSAIVLRALARDPRDRYGTAAELRRDLEHVAQEFTERETVGVSSPLRRDWPSAPFSLSGRRKARRLGAALVTSLAALGAWIAWTIASRPAPAEAFRERDWVLIADFDNLTGEALFDHTLRATLQTALQQSQYVNVVPRAQVLEGLRRMRRTDVVRVDEATALEIGRRENVRIVLAGAALAAGGTTRLSIRALGTSNGDLLFVKTEQFERKEELFDRIDSLARGVRESLGELTSRATAQTLPLARVTTQSLEALQLYSRAGDAQARGKIEESRDLLEAAVTRDPDFAMAHLHLGDAYSSLGQFSKTLEHYNRAYALRDRVTEREAHAITSSYFKSRDEYEKAAESWRILSRLYPDDLTARFELGMALYESGEFAAALEEFRHVQKLNPYHGSAHARLVLLLARMNQADEAVRVYDNAVSRGIETPYLKWGGGLAYMSQDRIDTARDTFRSLSEAGSLYVSLSDIYLAQADEYEGKLRAAEQRLDAGLALDRKSGNIANELLRRYLLGRVVLLRDDRVAAARHARAIIGTDERHLIAQNLYQAGTLFVRLGDVQAARSAAARLARLRARMPTGFHGTLLALLQGEIAFAEGRLQEAAASFESAAGGYPRYEAHEGAARVYERQSDWNGARQAWQRVIETRGHILQVGFAGDWPLAHLQMARACRRQEDLNCATAQYEKFIKLWAHGDDLTARREAEAELRQIAR
jgi:tetratricopeptide (TPR) repeat protein/predicted Ser/Thr protein kinase